LVLSSKHLLQRIFPPGDACRVCGAVAREMGTAAPPSVRAVWIGGPG